jgi:hypothetical protein
MTKDEVLKLALEALEGNTTNPVIDCRSCCKKQQKTQPTPVQPVQEHVGLIARLTNPEQHYEFTDPKKANAVLMSLCQEAADALAAPVPPAWFPAVENILNEYGLQAIDFVADFKAAMKDAEQAQRQWVGLTNAEMLKLQAEASVRHYRNTERMRGKQHSSEDEYRSIYARAIEAKLKEKNAAAQPEQEEDLYDLAVKADNWGQP